MGSKASTNLQQEDIDAIQKETGFKSNQIVRLYDRFTTLDKNSNGFLSQEDFLRVPELAINPLCDNIIRAFFNEENEGDGVNFRQFVRILARFRPVKPNDPQSLNSREEKLRFAFQMYDLNRDGHICRDELLKILHMMVGANISEEQLGSIADRTITEADADNDGVITFDEFVKIMEKVDIERKMSIRFLS